MKKVIYTCITAGYDPIKEPTVITPGWDYICFTDKLASSTAWQMKPTQAPSKLSNVKQARWHKTHPFELFPDADIVIWIDGSFIIQTNLDEFVKKRSPKTVRISAVKHPQRKCIYEEQAAVHQLGKDLPENTNQVNRYRDEGLPENFGLTETGILIYRDYPETKAFCRDWWAQIQHGSHRDQLAFDYIRWRTNLKIKHFTANVKKTDFFLTRHPKKLLFPQKKKGFDVVYTLGTGSGWNDNEIRYSIRSFAKYFRDLRHVVIVGELPVWAKNVIHIPWPDKTEYNTDQRIIDKLMAACRDPRVSNRFLFCSDDKLLLDNHSMSDFDGSHFGEIKEVTRPSEWQKRCYATKDELLKRGLPTLDYNKPHAIQPIDKGEYLEIMAAWKWQEEDYTGCNIYQNSTEIFKGANVRGTHLRLKEQKNHAEVISLIEGKKTMNYTERALNDAVKETLDALFPEQTSYELYGVKGTAMDEYKTWLAQEQPYDFGVRLLVKYTRNGRLIKYFQAKGESPRTRKQLANNLSIIARKW